MLGLRCSGTGVLLTAVVLSFAIGSAFTREGSGTGRMRTDLAGLGCGLVSGGICAAGGCGAGGAAVACIVFAIIRFTIANCCSAEQNSHSRISISFSFI